MFSSPPVSSRLIASSRRSLLVVLASLATVAGVFTVPAMLAPGAAAAAHPACARHALWKGLSRGSAQVRHARIVRPFGCDGVWAYAAVETNRFELTSLFHARRGEWVTVTRGRPCTRHEVPRRIRHAACDSN